MGRGQQLDVAMKHRPLPGLSTGSVADSTGKSGSHGDPLQDGLMSSRLGGPVQMDAEASATPTVAKAETATSAYASDALMPAFNRVHEQSNGNMEKMTTGGKDDDVTGAKIGFRGGDGFLGADKALDELGKLEGESINVGAVSQELWPDGDNIQARFSMTITNKTGTKSMNLTLEVTSPLILGVEPVSDDDAEAGMTMADRGSAGKHVRGTRKNFKRESKGRNENVAQLENSVANAVKSGSFTSCLQRAEDLGAEAIKPVKWTILASYIRRHGGPID